LLELLLLELPNHLKMNQGPSSHYEQLLLDIHRINLGEFCRGNLLRWLNLLILAKSCASCPLK
jgi:hypothetical protein